jgi:hypothetical protein
MRVSSAWNVQAADRCHRGAQDHAQRFIQHLVQTVGIAGRPLQGSRQRIRVSEASTPVLLEVGRQVVERLLGQLLGGEVLQHGTTGGPEGITEGGHLPERGEGQKEELRACL